MKCKAEVEGKVEGRSGGLFPAGHQPRRPASPRGNAHAHAERRRLVANGPWLVARASLARAQAHRVSHPSVSATRATQPTWFQLFGAKVWLANLFLALYAGFVSGNARNSNKRNEKVEMAKKANYHFGTVIQATLRPEDLIPAFIAELRSFRPLSRKVRASIREIEQNMRQADYWQSENVEYDLTELFDMLDEFAAPNFYFGAHPGDGSDFGFWQIEDEGPSDLQQEIDYIDSHLGGDK